MERFREPGREAKKSDAFRSIGLFVPLPGSRNLFVSSGRPASPPFPTFPALIHAGIRLIRVHQSAARHPAPKKKPSYNMPKNIPKSGEKLWKKPY